MDCFVASAPRNDVDGGVIHNAVILRESEYPVRRGFSS